MLSMASWYVAKYMYTSDITTEPCAPIGRSGKIASASGVDYLHCGEERHVPPYKHTNRILPHDGCTGNV